MNSVVEKEWVTKAGLTARVKLNESTGLPQSPTFDRMRKWRCGYVAVCKGSQLSGKDYEDSLMENLDVHGGLTFASTMRDDSRWWFGFDCLHLDDTIEIWTLERVVEECEHLAAQLVLLDRKGGAKKKKRKH